MKPFRKNVAIAIDGGGIRGIIAAKALNMLEQEMGTPAYKVFRLCAGTSTGSILAGGIAAGADSEALLRLYTDLGPRLFQRSFLSWAWLLRGYRYSREPLIRQFGEMVHEKRLGDLSEGEFPTELLTTTYDLVADRTRFVKSWKPEYEDWTILKAVLASSAAPTYFPVLEGQFTDGGVGAYNNPCFLAAYEITRYLRWDTKETTLISLGTGHTPEQVKVGEPNRFTVLDWLPRIIENRAQDASDQQVRLVSNLFPEMDFRRVQVDLEEQISVDDFRKTPRLLEYGEEMGRKLLSDELDPHQEESGTTMLMPRSKYSTQ
jgi:uncharacterized protein